MKKWGEITLGVITSVGGFLEVGSIATSAQAGAEYGYQLAWAVLLGLAGLALLMEMTGRLAAVSGRSYADLLRERFGFRFFVIPLLAVLLVGFLVLASEIAGVAVAMQMATGIAIRWWAIPVALLGWILLWRGTFSIVEQGTAALGLVALVFAVGAWKLHPQWGALGSALLPSKASHDAPRYWYLAVSILGASISPYLYLFYSAGAIEDGWTRDYLIVNRVTAWLGNLFGGGLNLALLVVAAMVFAPRHIHVDAYEQVGLLLTSPLGRAGFWLVIASLCVTCFGATVEITLAIAYLLAQGFGWPWSENLPPCRDARFSLSYSVAIATAAVPASLGADPLALTNVSMVLTAASLPVTVVPLLVLMNDSDVMNKRGNGWATNLALVALSILSIVLLAAAFPLQYLGGG